MTKPARLTNFFYFFISMLRGFSLFLSFLLSAKIYSVSAETPNDDRLQFNLAPFSIGNPTISQKPLKISIHGTHIDSAKNKFPLVIKQTFRANPGDTLARILFRAGVKDKDISKSIQSLKNIYNPKKFGLGQEVFIFFETDGEIETLKQGRLGNFIGFQFYYDTDSILKIEKTPTGIFKTSKQKRQLDSFFTIAEGEIHVNLYTAGLKSGLTEETLAELIRIFSWDVDFQRDIRKGDFFRVLFEKTQDKAGNLIKSKNIIFASLTLSKVPIVVYKFKDKSGNSNYYNEKGMSAQKALMRTPIDGARLSSRFGRRRHPILNYTMMHRGIDFAAPTGTPIFAAGNGLIREARWNGAYGRFILIRHNKKYSSAYAHLRRFAKGIVRGSRVKQGQIIGYVGSTGRSTGPHLHYEVRRDGRQINPLKLRMPPGKKLLGNELRRFKQVIRKIDKKFATLRLRYKYSESN